MNLKNYTSSVPMLNSISKIEHRLAQAGATHISKSYDKERPIGMMFQIPISGIPLTFKIPAKTDKVYDYMVKQRKSPPTSAMKENIRLQADRTAWKLLADWIDIQVSLIQLGQVEEIEGFLQYTYNPTTNKTLFERVKENMKMLTE